MFPLRAAFNILAPQDSTYDSVYIILNTPDEREKDALTQQWREHKLEELNFIGIVVSDNAFASLIWSQSD